MADLMLVLRLQLTEGLFVTHRHEHGVVAESALAPRWPYQRAVHASFESLRLAVVGPGDRERAGKMRRRRRIRLGRFGFAPDLFHCPHPVAVTGFVFGPAGREDARPTLERVDAKAAVVGERGKAAEVRRFTRLEVGVVGEAVADLFRIRKVELFGTDAADAKRLDQSGDLAQLAGIVGRDDQLVAERPHRPVAFSWAWKISEQPMRARRRSRSRPSSSKVSPSAVSCASTIAPSAVRT